MSARLTTRAGFRFAFRFVLACLGMSAIALADGTRPGAMHLALLDRAGGGAVRLVPGLGNEVESSLVRGIVGLREKGMKQAMEEIDGMLDRAPNFRLGHMVKGDMLMARAGKPVAFASLGGPANDSVAPLQDEARVRLKRYLEAPRLIDPPAPVLQLAPSQAHVLVVDTNRSRLFVYANDLGRPRYVTDFYISLGLNGVEKTVEGDQRTPLGVYRITEKKEKLPDFYGPNAFPIDYPNDWDKIQGRRGHGIWLHGTPSATYSRPPRATDGCIVLTNDDLEKLTRFVDVSRTPVVIVEALEWRKDDQWEASRDEFLASFARWKADWESLDVDRYLGHYAKDFRADRGGIAGWKHQKRKAAAGKTWVKVGVSEMSLFAYPGSKDVMVVTFEQDYRSNNMSSKTHKRQYWLRQDGSWRILHEALIS